MSDEEQDHFSDIPVGTAIRLMSDEDVDIPLWGNGGLLFTEVDDLVAFGVPRNLADAVRQWAIDRMAAPEGSAELDLRAVDLVRNLAEALDHEYEFSYQP